MQFDAKQMSALLKKSDSELWRIVSMAAKAGGISLPEGQPSAGDMARLRAILAGKSEKDVGEALDTLRRARGES
ncbi:MAG: hypothetical protein IJF73_07075 [Clostridia bacterium]|nr:hypothetical protein [Clostridia bacterium]